jgi:hypothetical protein
MKTYVFYNNVPLNSLEMKNVPGKSCMENQNAQFMFKKFFPENLAVYGFVQARVNCNRFDTRLVFKVRSCWHLAQPPNCSTTSCRLSATACSIYSQLSSILETVPPSATSGRAMPWWQGPTYHGTTWNNVAQPNRPHMTIKRSAEKIRFSCRMPTARIDTLLIFSTYCFRTD